MDVSELECPNCQALLELDSGFAGGVCRCFHCGTLMTVPADPVRNAPERLVRPDRPDAPVLAPTIDQRPEAPGDARSPAPTPSPPGAMPGSPPPSTPAPPPTAPMPPQPPAQPPVAPPAPSVPPSRPATSPPAPPPPGSVPSQPAPAPVDVSQLVGTYVTETGRKVEITQKTNIPTARLRRKAIIRGTTKAIVFTIVGFVLLLTAAAVYFVMAPKGPTKGPEINIEQGFDPAVNPFEMDEANFMQVKLADRTVIAIEAGSMGPEMFSACKKMVVSLARKSGDNEVQVIYFRAKGRTPYLFPGDKATKVSDKIEKLEAFHFDKVRYDTRSGDPVQAVKRAINAKPDKIILVVGTLLDEGEKGSIDEALSTLDSVIFSAVVINEDGPEIQALTEAHGGQYIAIKPEVIEGWLAEVK